LNAKKWAKIVLIIEQTLTTDARRCQQIKYSQPMKDGRRALPIRWDRRVRVAVIQFSFGGFATVSKNSGLFKY
jgi:hypothetical protein